MDRTTIQQSRRIFLSTALATFVYPTIASSQNVEALQNSLKDPLMKIQIAFANHVFTATLENNVSALALLKMLPLDLSIEDYSNNEKITYLPSKLPGDGSAGFTNEQPGDIGYYAPWGNLAFYHGKYRYSNGLIRLGRLDGGIEPLLTKGTFSLRIHNAGAK